jgi:hypothetical protein
MDLKLIAYLKQVTSMSVSRNQKRREESRREKKGT